MHYFHPLQCQYKSTPLIPRYALFDRYAPKDRASRRRTTITQLGIGENDLWIAAVALQHQLTLVTTDQDFQRIQSVQPFDLESWT
jgi:tRNA(fMet)-specific endonuclease VapC